jgi:putative phage-type endonuclease
MTLTILDDLEQGSEAWHTARRGIVTASVVGKLIAPTLKVADNDTSRGLTNQLAAERITGWTDPTYTSDDMWRGILHEPIARAKYAETNGVTVDEVGFMVRDDWGFKIGASPDGLIGEDGGLEIKCPKAKTHIATVITDRVPAYYMAQVQTNLLVSGREWWDFASFCSGLALWTKRVYLDPQWQEAIVAAVAGFEEKVAAITSAYFAQARNLPATERIPDDIGMVI